MRSPTSKAATRVRSLRRRHGWTQQQLADRMEVDVVTVSRWERAVVAPRRGAISAIERIAGRSATEASVDQLVRVVGTDRALRALRQVALLETAPRDVKFPVDPGVRLRELDSMLTEQRDLVARAKRR